MIKTHVRGFFDTDLHEVSWYFATHEAVRPSGFLVQLTECVYQILVAILSSLITYTSEP